MLLHAERLVRGVSDEEAVDLRARICAEVERKKAPLWAATLAHELVRRHNPACHQPVRAWWARAERWWPLKDGSFLCGPDLVLDDGTLSETGVTPFYEVQHAECRITRHSSLVTRQPSAIYLAWETFDVDEFSSDWLTPPFAIRHPQSLE